MPPSVAVQRSQRLWLVGIAVIGIGCKTSGAARAPLIVGPGPRPNVLFIAVDDLRPDLGTYGHPVVHSPNIDRLAAQGIRFERAYAQQALCSPSRVSLMTGLRPDATRIYDLETHFRKVLPNAVTLPQHFMRNGYHTECYGKIYHAALTDPRSWTVQGSRFEPNPGRGNWRHYLLAENIRIADANNGAGPPYEAADVADDAYPDGQIASNAISALGRLRDRPFFLAVGFYKPHLPFNVPKRYWDLYNRDKMVPPDQTEPPSGTPQMALSHFGELRAYAGMPKTGPIDPETARALIHGYRAAVSYTDAQVGRVLAELDRQGLRKNTIVVLWGDHGWKLGDYGAWSKHSNFEMDTRVPLIVSAPGVTPGQKSSALVELVDLYPTLVELAGLPTLAQLQGTSMVPLLFNPGRAWKATALSQYPRGRGVMGFSMRTDRWRYTRWQKTDAGRQVVGRELHDHSNGPVVQHNLADDPAKASVVSELDALLTRRWAESLKSP